MPDKPVQPLTLYRLTLEMDDRDAFEFFRRWFMGGDGSPNDLLEARAWIIGVESRVRERIKR